jgi:hypothetical protein
MLIANKKLMFIPSASLLQNPMLAVRFLSTDKNERVEKK